MNRIAVAIGLVAVMGGFGGIADARAPSGLQAGNKKIVIDRLVQREMISRGIPGLQITIVRHRKIVFTGVYGQANIENATPVTEQTAFPINSISKAFAGVAAMQLVEAGRLKLDAPLATYLEGLPASWRSITVRQILTHSSGLPEIVDDNVRLIDGAEPDAAWAKVQELPLRFSPGERFAYTQTNYLVMGKIIEKLAGKSFSEFVRDRQFAVAGMKRTGFGDPANVPPHVASLYTFLHLLTEGTKTVGVERSKTAHVRHEAWPEYLRPAAGIQATSTDLAEWVIALQKLKLISKDSLEQLWTPEPMKDGNYGGFSSIINGYALGWPSARRPFHPAFTPVGGERAAMFVYPKDDLTVIVLTNLMGASPQTFIDEIASLYIPGLVVQK
jgi:CubicO group peptidase (beta-lactamase class C family)